MHVDGLRRRRLALLKKKKFDLRAHGQDAPEAHKEHSEGTKSSESDLDREISLLECARRDLI